MSENNPSPETGAGEALLAQIDGPADLTGLSDAELTQVAQEVRELIIDTIGEIGG
ncbi:MAG: 1-deoxy-D-xylulose-5-phosphate synthase N-terminal domain-containing protein, partial [bacterium]